MTQVHPQTPVPERAGVAARQQLLAGFPVTERTLRLNGISTPIIEAGKGTPLVMLHGPGAYGASWFRVISGLAATNRLIMPDLPGHGMSELNGATLDLRRVLDWLGELIERTCSGPPVLLGHIFGAIAARFVIEHPNRVSRLVLVDTLGLVPFNPHPDFGAALTRFMSDPTAENHDRLWGYCAHDVDRLRGEVGPRWDSFKAYNLELARKPSAVGAVQALLEQFGFAAIPPEELAGIKVPTTLIWGRHDLATPLSVAEAAAARYGWRLEVIDACADAPPMEKPEEFVEAVKRSGK